MSYLKIIKAKIKLRQIIFLLVLYYFKSYSRKFTKIKLILYQAKKIYIN